MSEPKGAHWPIGGGLEEVWLDCSNSIGRMRKAGGRIHLVSTGEATLGISLQPRTTKCFAQGVITGSNGAVGPV